MDKVKVSLIDPLLQLPYFSSHGDLYVSIASHQFDTGEKSWTSQEYTWRGNASGLGYIQYWNGAHRQDTCGKGDYKPRETRDQQRLIRGQDHARSFGSLPEVQAAAAVNKSTTLRTSDFRLNRMPYAIRRPRDTLCRQRTRQVLCQ